MGQMLNRRRVMSGHGEVIMTSETNPEVLAVCYAQGWAKHANYMTLKEAQNVTNIGTVFKDNTQITHFEELQYFGITTLFHSAFYGCSNLRQVTLKENLRFNGRVFQNSGLTSIVIPYGVTFANNDFGGCTSLVSIQLYDGLVNMPDLSGCTSLTRVDVPSSVRGYTSMRSDTSLVYINCPEGVTSIPAQCFRDCSSLPSVELPSTITSIGESAFRSMRSLSSFIIHAVTPPTLGGNNVFNTTCMFYVPAESVEAYKTASGWSSFADRIQAIDETTYIQDGLIFQLDGIAKGNSADTSTWVDLKGGLVFTQEGVVESLANGWHFDGTCYLTCSTLLPGNSDYTVEVCMSNFILWHNGSWGNGYPYFYNVGKALYFLQRNVSVTVDNILTVVGSPFTASLNLDTCYINKILYTGRGSSNFFSDPNRFDIGLYRDNHSTGTIYAIRIYNRRLTSEEQLHNQNVDITRFNISV